MKMRPCASPRSRDSRISASKANALDLYTATLKDKDGKVVTAALEALGNLHDPKSLQALLEYGKKHKDQREFVTALAQINDPQTLPIMLDALNNNDQRVRRAAVGALKKMQAQSWPLDPGADRRRQNLRGLSPGNQECVRGRLHSEMESPGAV